MSMKKDRIAELRHAAENMDWQQVVLNGGPPCFHLEDGRFCGRAQRWDGHRQTFFNKKRSYRFTISSRSLI